MLTLLSGLTLLGAIISMVMILVCLFKRNGKAKKWLAFFLFLCFILGSLPNENEKAAQASSDTQAEQNKAGDANSDSELEAMDSDEDMPIEGSPTTGDVKGISISNTEVTSVNDSINAESELSEEEKIQSLLEKLDTDEAIKTSLLTLAKDRPKGYNYRAEPVSDNGIYGAWYIDRGYRTEYVKFLEGDRFIYFNVQEPMSTGQPAEVDFGNFKAKHGKKNKGKFKCGAFTDIDGNFEIIQHNKKRDILSVEENHLIENDSAISFIRVSELEFIEELMLSQMHDYFQVDRIRARLCGREYMTTPGDLDDLY